MSDLFCEWQQLGRMRDSERALSSASFLIVILPRGPACLRPSWPAPSSSEGCAEGFCADEASRSLGLEEACGAAPAVQPPLSFVLCPYKGTSQRSSGPGSRGKLMSFQWLLRSLDADGHRPMEMNSLLIFSAQTTPACSAEL